MNILSSKYIFYRIFIQIRCHGYSFQQRDTNLSDQQARVKDGKVPLPIYTSIRVKRYTPATEFHGNFIDFQDTSVFYTL